MSSAVGSVGSLCTDGWARTVGRTALTVASATLDEEFNRVVIGGAPDPRPFYAELRERAPVYRSERGFFYVTRYDIATSMFKDSDWSVNVSSSNTGGWRAGRPSVAYDIWHSTILNMDGTEHNRVRRIVSKTFSPAGVKLMRGQVDAVIAAELARLDGRTEIELCEDFARTLPTRIILNIMGIGHEHLDRVLSMSHGITSLYEPNLTEDMLKHADKAVGEWADIVRGLVAERRRSPGPDLLTALVEASDEGDRLSEDELVAMVVALVQAGHETTGSTLPVSLYHLLNAPDQLERLRADRSIMKTAVEELMRYDAATRGAVPRYAVRDLDLAGVSIRKGETVIVGNQAANHDPAVFENPLILDLTRYPNKHISFFGGAHYCLGGWLARMEVASALDAILTRYPSIEVAGEVKWRPSFMIRALEGLPLKVATS
jgi:cytochrome P450